MPRCLSPAKPHRRLAVSPGSETMTSQLNPPVGTCSSALFKDPPGMVSTRHAGTPQSGPPSPLLSNILLDDVDKELERRGHRFCRYADGTPVQA